MRRHDELRNGQQEEGHGQAPQHAEDGQVGAQGGEEEDDGEEAPEDEEDAEVDGEGAHVAPVGGLNAEGRDEKHGKSEPEGAVGAVEGAAKGITNAEFHDTGDQLGETTEEDGEAEYCLVWAYGPKSVGVREAVRHNVRETRAISDMSRFSYAHPTPHW